LRASTSGTPRWHLPLLCLLGLPLFFYGLGSYSVVNGDEGFYHSVAAVMVDSGDWFKLDYYGQHRVYDTFMNAPLQYWARAVLIVLFGDNLWTMRLLSASFGLLTVLAVYRLGATLDSSQSKRTALFAALIQLTSFQFVYLHSARTGELDSIVAFLMTATALSFVRGVREARSFVPHHLCLAALLTVKLPIVAIPVLAELLFFASTGSLRTHFKRYVLSALAIVPLGLVWHMFQAGILWEDFLGVAGKMRAEASGAKGGGDFSGGPLSNVAWYAKKLLFGAFPWSLAFVPAIGASLVLAVRRARDAEGVALRVLLLFALLVWVFFAFVSKRFSWYILPALPMFAVVTAWWLRRLTEERSALAAILVSAIVTLLVGSSIPLTSVRPLSDRTPRVPMDLAWRELAPLGTTTTLLALFVLLALVLWIASRRWPEVAPRRVSSALFAILLVFASVRVALPLGTLENESELERAFRRVEASRVEGRAVRYPLALPDSMGFLRVRHYFGKRYHVEQRSTPRGMQILITGEKTPPGLEIE